MWSFFLGFSLFLTQTIFCSEFENAIPHEREGSFAPVIPPVTRSTTQKPSTTVHPDNHEYNNHNRSSCKLFKSFSKLFKLYYLFIRFFQFFYFFQLFYFLHFQLLKKFCSVIMEVGLFIDLVLENFQSRISIRFYVLMLFMLLLDLVTIIELEFWILGMI